jgi:hypothetical protein
VEKPKIVSPQRNVGEQANRHAGNLHVQDCDLLCVENDLWAIHAVGSGLGMSDEASDGESDEEIGDDHDEESLYDLFYRNSKPAFWTNQYPNQFSTVYPRGCSH